MKATVQQIKEFYEKYPEHIGKIEVETRYGYKTIEYADITSYNSFVITITTETEKSISISPDHLLFYEKNCWIPAKELNVGDKILTKNGYEKIIKIYLEKEKEDLYDLQVSDVKEYYANKIVSHNSTILDAIVFALYGKPHRKINKSQLINSINQKELLVEIEFSVGGNDYLIRRGMRPNIFEIWKNNELVNQDAASRDYQEYLEKNILKMDFKSFNQIVILGSATYVPFMELSTSARREIIEDLLDIQIFSTMNILLKERINENKIKISENNYQIELIKSKIESAIEHNNSIRKIKEIEVNKIRDKIQEHVDTIEKENREIEKIECVINELISIIQDKSSIKRKLEKAKSIRSNLEIILKNFEKELIFYHDNDNCPTCKQSIDKEFKNIVICEKIKKKQEIEDGLLKINQKIIDYENRINNISEIEDEIQKNNLKIGEHRAQIKISMNAIDSYKKDLKIAEKEVKDVDLSKLKEYKSILKELQKEQKDLLDRREVLAVASSLLKDGGIKTKIIRQYIPIMNKLINKYLAAFDLFVNFELDENFNEVIKSRFRDTFSYDSFSEGEKLRITLSIMLAWRAIAKLRNSVSTNLLIMDETLDGSLDAIGIENLIDTLHSLNSNDNIFVISHRGQIFQDKFERHISFEKVKNFSQMISTQE
jgi:DNA repair exonuclease SbcCD ATPase subunit